MTTTPTVNLNGTSRGDLLTQTGEAVDALHNALEALHEAAPHGRDYQIGAASYEQARVEHDARVDAVRKVFQEMTTIHLSLVENTDTRLRALLREV